MDPLAGHWTFHAPDEEAPLAAVLPMPGVSPEGLTDDALVRRDPPPYTRQPPWWDGGPYDLSETVRMVADHLLHARAA